MLPTQFIPEYYRDAKDIRWAEQPEELEKGNPGTRPSLFARIRKLFRRPARKPESEQTEHPGRLAH